MKTMPLVRLAELEIDPEQIDNYRARLETEIAASVSLEPGVLMLCAQSVKGSPTTLRLLEVYADEAAYKSHLKSPHFITYKAETEDMVLSLRLLEMDPIRLAGRPEVFAN